MIICFYYMFWKKKNEKVEEVKEINDVKIEEVDDVKIEEVDDVKIEEIKKLTEEELIANDNKILTNFDNSIKKVGEFIIYNINNETERAIAIKTTITDDTNIGIQKLSKEDDKWEMERIQRGYVWVVSCGGIRLAFYDFNNAQKYLYKYLELLSS